MVTLRVHPSWAIPERVMLVDDKGIQAAQSVLWEELWVVAEPAAEPLH